MKSLAGQSEGTVVFRLRSGDTATGRDLVRVSRMLRWCRYPTAQTPHAIATDKPHRSDMVTVMSDTPVDMSFADVAHADVPEGTPIIDDEGALVGLCSRRDDGTTEVIEVDQVPVDPADIDVGATTVASDPATVPSSGTDD